MYHNRGKLPTSRTRCRMAKGLRSKGKPKGQVSSLIIVGIAVLVLLGVAFALVQLLMGGSEEAQNAVDAGNLNVAYTALRQPAVSLEELGKQNADCREFFGVSTRSGSQHYIHLSNVNRMWGQVLLSALNAHMMPGNRGTAWTNVKRLYAAAELVSRKLTGYLINDDDKGSLVTAFKDLSRANTLRMLRAEKPEPQNNKPETSYVDRWEASNLFFSNVQLGDDNARLRTVLDSPAAGNLGAALVDLPGKQGPFLRGYRILNVPAPLGTAGGVLKMAFVPLEVDKTSHLISAKAFGKDQDRSFLGKLQAVIPPDAFSYRSKTQEKVTSQNNELRNVAFAVSKAGDASFSGRFPQAIIRIKNDPGYHFSGLNGTGGGDFHAIDWAHRQIGKDFYKAYNSLAYGKETAGLKFAQSMLNPIDIPWGHFSKAHLVNFIRATICWSKGPGGKNICGDDPQPFGALRFLCCYLWKYPPINITCGPIHKYEGFNLKMTHLFKPGFEENDKSCAQNVPAVGSLPFLDLLLSLAGPTGGSENFSPWWEESHALKWYYTVYQPQVEVHRAFFDWERGNSAFVWLGVMIEMAVEGAMSDFRGSGDPGAAFYAAIIGSFFPDPDILLSYVLSWIFSQDVKKENVLLQINPQEVISGMAKLKDASETGSLFWKTVPSISGPRTLASDATIRNLFMEGGRQEQLNQQGLIAKLKQRIHELSYTITDAQVNDLLNSNKVLPMGTSAYIYYDEPSRTPRIITSGELASAPEWVRQAANAAVDGDRSARFLSIYKNPDQNQCCYKLVDPKEDWGWSYWKHSAAYPSYICSQDEYLWCESSGYGGILAELELRSRLNMSCKRNGAFNGSWQQPHECFDNRKGVPFL
jgi:hypothetical protein